MLEANVPGCTVTGQSTAGITGAFEVVNAKTGKVYHSKLNGGGYLDDKAKVAKVIDAVKADNV